MLPTAFDISKVTPEYLSESAPQSRLLARTEAFEIRITESVDGYLLAVKSAREASDTTRDSLRRQFNALQEIDSKSSGALRDSIPYPVLLRDDMMVTTALPGEQVSKLLRRRANSLTGWQNLDVLRCAGRRLGEWLSKFHSLTRSPSQIFRSAEYLKDLENNLAAARNADISEAVLNQIGAKAEEISSQCMGKELAMAACHGEFLPQNILILEDQVAVVDFDTYSAAGPIYNDLAMFVGYVALLCSKKKYSSRAMIALAESVLSGYSADFVPMILRLFVINAMLGIATHPQSEALEDADRQAIQRALADAVEHEFPPRAGPVI